MQDAWLAIVREIRRLDDPARFRSWAYRIVANKCADWTRRRVARRMAMTTMKDSAAPASRCSSNEPEAADEVGRMRAALVNLPDYQRAILSLCYLDGMGIAEIARTFGIPEGTVKSRLYHAKNRLRQTLERVDT